MSTYLFVHEYLDERNEHTKPSLDHKRSLPLKGEVIVDIAPALAPRMSVTLGTHLGKGECEALVQRTDVSGP